MTNPLHPAIVARRKGRRPCWGKGLLALCIFGGRVRYNEVCAKFGPQKLQGLTAAAQDFCFMTAASLIKFTVEDEREP